MRQYRLEQSLPCLRLNQKPVSDEKGNAGISATTKALNEGTAEPVVGPAQTVLAVLVFVIAISEIPVIPLVEIRPIKVLVTPL
jgi:hypothetical protein